MRDDIEKRAIEEAEYIIKNKATVRGAAKDFGVSKSTIHKDITERLEKIDKRLWRKVSEVLKKNRDERHIRGGIATKRKYEKISKEKKNKL